MRRMMVHRMLLLSLVLALGEVLHRLLLLSLVLIVEMLHRMLLLPLMCRYLEMEQRRVHHRLPDSRSRYGGLLQLRSGTAYPGAYVPGQVMRHTASRYGGLLP